jgi:Protein of unknown function (DUF1360)
LVSEIFVSFYWLVLGTLAVWRVVHLLNAEDGPWGLVTSFRRLAGEGFWGEVLDCFYCLSLWVGAPLGVFLGQSWAERLLLWLAFSGGASLLEQATSRQKDSPLTSVTEGKDNNYVLWKESSSVAQQRDP